MNKYVGAACYFSYNFLKFTIQSYFLSSKGKYFSCTTNLITSHENQPLFLALGGWLEEINKTNKIDKYLGHNK